MMGQQAPARFKGSVRLGNYLRRLRSGYGYSLRKVEEKARAEGGEIDNSQLSRYEKGICYPSFDKLRILASVFNVPVQAFSDVVDLEEYEDLQPDSDNPEELLEAGHLATKAGKLAEAFACYERALEVLEEHSDLEDHRRLTVRARVSLAIALRRLGKLALAEHELRRALRSVDGLDAVLAARVLLDLANVHADQGDLLLGDMEAQKARAFAEEQGLEQLAAEAIHTHARMLAGRGRTLRAIRGYREAAERYAGLGDHYEATRVRINIGGCYVSLGKTREAIRILRATLAEARVQGHRRLEAHAWSYLGEAYWRLGNPQRARNCLRESDAIAGTGDEKYTDLLFVNAFYEWEMARQQGNPTREKIAFGRLKALRSGLERRFPEVEAFDAQVEGGRSHA